MSDSPALMTASRWREVARIVFVGAITFAYWAWGIPLGLASAEGRWNPKPATRS